MADDSTDTIEVDRGAAWMTARYGGTHRVDATAMTGLRCCCGADIQMSLGGSISAGVMMASCTNGGAYSDTAHSAMADFTGDGYETAERRVCEKLKYAVERTYRVMIEHTVTITEDSRGLPYDDSPYWTLPRRLRYVAGDGGSLVRYKAVGAARRRKRT